MSVICQIPAAHLHCLDVLDGIICQGIYTGDLLLCQIVHYLLLWLMQWMMINWND